MKKYTEIQTLRLTKTQKETLIKLKGLNINIQQFIRLAIKEKLTRNFKEIKEKTIKVKVPF